jgi:hypothetical protein
MLQGRGLCRRRRKGDGRNSSFLAVQSDDSSNGLAIEKVAYLFSVLILLRDCWNRKGCRTAPLVSVKLRSLPPHAGLTTDPDFGARG